jgi:hypothetical protein
MSRDISAIRFGQELQDKEGAEFRRLNSTDMWAEGTVHIERHCSRKLDRATNNRERLQMLLVK